MLSARIVKLQSIVPYNHTLFVGPETKVLNAHRGLEFEPVGKEEIEILQRAHDPAVRRDEALVAFAELGGLL